MTNYIVGYRKAWSADLGHHHRMDATPDCSCDCGPSGDRTLLYRRITLTHRPFRDSLGLEDYVELAELAQTLLNEGVDPHEVAEKLLADGRLVEWEKSPFFWMDANSRRIANYLKWRMEGVGEK